MNEHHVLERCRLTFFLAIFGLLLGCSQLVYSQQDQKVVILNHADSLVGMEIDGEPAQQLIGNVKFTQGRVVVTCAKAIRYLRSKKITMEGEVEVLDSTMRMVSHRGVYHSEERVVEALDRVLLEDGMTTLHAGYGKYFVDEKKAQFTRNVLVQDTASVLTAHELIYFREDQRSIATGNVIILQPENNLTISGNHFEHLRKQKYSKMTDQPRLMQIDTAADGTIDTLTVTSMVMESHSDSLERLVATDSVQMIRNGLAAEAGLCVFYTDLDSIVLQKNPFIWYTTERNEDNQVSGDSIFIKLKKRKLETVYVRRRATAISRADSLCPDRFNQMTGEEIIMHFAYDKIQQIDVDKTATSLYYLFDEGKPNGLNKTTGDHVTITFLDGRIDKIKVLAGVEGQYFPEKMVKGRESEYNLEGFNWREERPGKRRVVSMQESVGSKQ
ncbi:MAG: hypothetical protein HY707_12645 [Ignavibacteriae bacterium]|nr:hypothetical protein [Ignavibacteriota bacterium]